MTEFRKRQQIGMLDGWHCIGGCFDPDYKGWIHLGDPDKQSGMKSLPKYDTHEQIMSVAKKILTHFPDRARFIGYLYHETSATYCGNDTDTMFTMLNSTVEQLTDSLLRAMGKWID